MFQPIKKLKEKIKGKLILSSGMSAKLEMYFKDKKIEIYGEKVAEAMMAHGIV